MSSIRLVCEVHEASPDHYGFLGENLKLLFSPKISLLIVIEKVYFHPY